MSIPVISCLDLYGSKREETIQVLGEAFLKFGFVRIKNHGISETFLNDAFETSKSFFSQDESIKNVYYDEKLLGQRGYIPKLKEHAKGETAPDLKEFWHVGRNISEEDNLGPQFLSNVWPSEPVQFKDVFVQMYNQLDDLAFALLEGLAIFLGEQDDRLTKMAVNGNSILRLLHYPPLNDFNKIKGSIRAAAHGDINLITLLVSSTASGLEIFTKEKTWLPVNNGPNEIIADAGDMLELITKGKIPATIHRVVNPTSNNESRYSMPFFVHPRPEVKLSILETCQDGENKDTHIMTSQEFLEQRLIEIGLK
jgi:isopenicillin N synthase-like dioxygenase